MLDAFEHSFIQHLVFHCCVECRTYSVECVLNVFISIRMPIICGLSQKGHRQNKRKETKMAIKKGKDLQQPLTIYDTTFNKILY